MNLKQTNFSKHLFILKIQLFLIFILYLTLIFHNYFNFNELFYLLIKPFFKISGFNYFIYHNIDELFYTKLIFSVIISTYLIFWLFLYKLWLFLTPGLKKLININIFIFLLTIVFITILYNKIIYIYILPSLINFFFFNFNSNTPFELNIYLEPDIYNCIFFIIKIIILLTFIFLYFILLLLLFCLKIFNINWILKYRKIFHFKLILVTILITPPEIFSQIVIGIFLLIIYELIVFFLLIK